MKPELHRILDSFAAVVRRRRGEIRKIEVGLVREPGYFSRVVSGRRAITLERLIDSLEALGQDVGQFFRGRAFPEVDLYGMLEAIPTLGREPEVVKELRRTARELGRVRGEASEPEEERPGWLLEGPLRERLDRLMGDSTPATLGFVLGAVRLLDELRSRKPWEAAKLARALAVGVCPRIEEGAAATEAFCASSGTFASAHRVAGSLEISVRSLREILPLAEGLRPDARASLYLRISGILADYARYEDALRVSESAAKIYAGLRDGEGLGRAFVDQGVILVNMEEGRGAVEAFQLALTLLPKDSTEFRIPALQGLAWIRHQLGDNQRARRDLGEAMELLGPSESYPRALLLRLRGDIERAEEELTLAEDCYREARRQLAGLNPFDTALVTLDLIAVLLRQGETAKAVRESLSMNSLLQPLSAHPIAEAALLQLRKVALRGELDPSKLRAIRGRIEAGRTRAA